MAHGFLIRLEGSLYRLGPKLMMLGKIYERSNSLISISRPILRELASITGESAKLFVIQGTKRICSLSKKDHPVPTDLIVRKELQIMGSLIYTNEFPKSMDILKSGKIKTDLLNTGKLSLNELDNALREFTSPERLKMLVEI